MSDPQESQVNSAQLAGTQRREYHAARTAESHALFFLPFLRSGMHLVDCGCGPGTITVDLAEVVAPGEVLAYDRDEAALVTARERAESRTLSNISFEEADVNNLPIPDASVDAVFSHAVLEYVDDPIATLEEFYRVIKSGGVVGVRTPDLDGTLWSPTNPVLELHMKYLIQYSEMCNVDRRRGKFLREYMVRAGFQNVKVTASYDVYATTETTHFIVEPFIRAAQEEDNPWVEAGILDSQTLKQIGAALEQWADHPHAFLALPWVEAVAWKP